MHTAPGSIPSTICLSNNYPSTSSKQTIAYIFVHAAFCPLCHSLGYLSKFWWEWLPLNFWLSRVTLSEVWKWTFLCWLDNPQRVHFSIISKFPWRPSLLTVKPCLMRHCLLIPLNIQGVSWKEATRSLISLYWELYNLESIYSNADAHDNSHLWSQHSGGEGRKIRSSGSSYRYSEF